MFPHATQCAMFLLLAVFFVPFSQLLAEESYIVGSIASEPTFRWNNENWFTLPHPKVIEFTVKEDGSAYGLTETGVTFIQYNVANDAGIRIQRFEMEDHYHYVIEGEIAYSFEELSKKLALAYERLLASA